MAMTAVTAAAPPPPVFFGGGGSSNAARSSTSSSSSSSFSPSITIISVILVTTVVVSVGICLLLRHLNRRCIRHLSAVSSSSTATSSVTAGVDSLRHSNRRVSPETNVNSVIDSLPIFTLSAVTRRRAPSTFNGGDCAVCLSKFESHDQLRLLPLCCHAFHVECIDTWLVTNQTCPLCRSALHISDSELVKTELASSNDTGNNSFRLQIGSLSRRRQTASTDFGEPRVGSYSIGSFDYIVDDDDSEIFVNQTHRISASDHKESEPEPADSTAAQNLAAEIGGGRSWLHDYVERLSSLSSRTMSFRSSSRFFIGSSRRTDIAVAAGDYDLEGNRVGEEISEMFRWFSGI